MQNALLTKFIQKNKGAEIPTFRPGDTIRVHVKIKEGDKERLQAFEAPLSPVTIPVWAKASPCGRSASARASSASSRWHAKVIDHIDVVRTGRTRRSKLYYLRALKGKAARLKEREQ